MKSETHALKSFGGEGYFYFIFFQIRNFDAIKIVFFFCFVYYRELVINAKLKSQCKWKCCKTTAKQ